MTRKLAGKRIAIIVANEFEDIELLYPMLRLSEEGADIDVVPVLGGSHPRPYLGETKPVTGRYGHTVPMRILREGVRYRLRKLEELRLDDLDCLFFPGGFSPDILRRNEHVLELVREMYRAGKLLATICHGPWILISARVVEGKRVTGFLAVKDDLMNAGAKFVDAPALRDGQIITGRGPDDLPEFCQVITEALSEVSPAKV